jgi:hypothetical protein
MYEVWFVLGGMALGVAALLVFALMKVARDSDRAARRTERMLLPLSDVTVTHAGSTRW